MDVTKVQFFVTLALFCNAVHAIDTQILISPQSSTASFGNVLLLPCVVVTDNPSVSILWMHNGSVINESAQFRVNQSTRVILQSNNTDSTLLKSVLQVCVDAKNVGGEYKCMAVQENQGSLQEEMFNIRIADPYVQILVAPGDWELQSPQSLSVLCAATGSPKPNITWLHNGSPVGSDPSIIHREHKDRNGGKITVATLTICSSRASNGGLYHCVADNQHATYEAPFTLSSPPSLQFLLPTSAVSVDIGSNESLSCGFLGYPPPNVTWIFNQRVISADRQVVDGTVTYLRVDRSILQSGEYVCVGENYLGRANYTFQVVVNIPVEIIIEPKVENPIPSPNDSSITLLCVAYGFPSPIITWKKDNNTITDENRIDVSTLLHGVPLVKSFLVFCPPLSGERGSYKCEVNNGVSKDVSAPADVCWHEATDDFGILVSPRDTAVKTARTYYFPCVAYSLKNDTVNITWSGGSPTTRTRILNEKKPKNMGDIQFVRSILEISHLSAEDVTIPYMCSAVKGNQTVTSNFTLEFNSAEDAAPVFKEPVDAKQEVKHMGTITLYCQVTAHPSPIITWEKDNISIEETRGVTIQEISAPCYNRTLVNSTLELIDVTEKDSGDYKCRARNRAAKIDMPDIYKVTVLPGKRPDSSGIARLREGLTYVSYVGSAISVITLLVGIFIVIIAKLCHCKIEPIAPLLNFYVATALLYILYTLSSAIDWQETLCVVFSSLFHYQFLVAILSLSSLIFLNFYSRSSTKIHYVALPINWALPVLVIIVSVSPDIQNYKNLDLAMCVPTGWPLWLGLMLPFAALHSLTLLVAAIALVVCQNSERRDLENSSTKCCKWKEGMLIAILLLFDIAWAVKFPGLLLSPAEHSIALEVVFFIATVSIGAVSIVHLCLVLRGTGSYYITPHLEENGDGDTEEKEDDTVKEIISAICPGGDKNTSAKDEDMIDESTDL